jgi:hypothetical protein
MTCEFCRRDYWPREAGQRFCGPECRQRWHAADISAYRQQRRADPSQTYFGRAGTGLDEPRGPYVVGCDPTVRAPIPPAYGGQPSLLNGPDPLGYETEGPMPDMTRVGS